MGVLGESDKKKKKKYCNKEILLYIFYYLCCVMQIILYDRNIIFSFWNYAPIPDSSRRLYARSSSFLHKHQSLTDR